MPSIYNTTGRVRWYALLGVVLYMDWMGVDNVHPEYRLDDELRAVQAVIFPSHTDPADGEDESIKPADDKASVTPPIEVEAQEMAEAGSSDHISTQAVQDSKTPQEVLDEVIGQVLGAVELHRKSAKTQSQL